MVKRIMSWSVYRAGENACMILKQKTDGDYAILNINWLSEFHAFCEVIIKQLSQKKRLLSNRENKNCTKQ